MSAQDGQFSFEPNPDSSPKANRFFFADGIVTDTLADFFLMRGQPAFVAVGNESAVALQFHDKSSGVCASSLFFQPPLRCRTFCQS